MLDDLLEDKNFPFYATIGERIGVASLRRTPLHLCQPGR